MSAIITNVSSVSSFVKDTVSEYNQIVSLADAALSRINDISNIKAKKTIESTIMPE